MDHPRLLMGTSMGGMRDWLRREIYRDFMDPLLPPAWRRVIIDAIGNDPAWRGGEYLDQPPSPKTAAEMLFLTSSDPVVCHEEAPTWEAADQALDEYAAWRVGAMDADDVL